MSAAVADQLDLLDLIPKPEPTLPRSIFGTPSRGLRARLAEYEQWQEQYGNFGSSPFSHGWKSWMTLGGDHTDRCYPVILSADLRPFVTGHIGPGGLLYRGECTGCDWEGPVRGCEAEAVEDAHDHSWPGWRDLPIVPRPPNVGMNPKARHAAVQKWLAEVTKVMPAGWIETGGPIITERDELGRRDVENRTGMGGFDLAARAFHRERAA